MIMIMLIMRSKRMCRHIMYVIGVVVKERTMFEIVRHDTTAPSIVTSCEGKRSCRPHEHANVHEVSKQNDK